MKHLLSCLFLTVAALGLWWAAAGASRQARAARELPAEMKPYTETIPGTEVKFEMVPAPGGTFVMGSPASEAGHQADEAPQHEASVGPFWMGKTEVTWDEYQLFALAPDVDADKKKAAAGPGDAGQLDAVTRPTPPYADETHGYGREGNPAISMTHHAAMEYAAWLSAMTGRNYRLPTEAEWEYAARAGSKTAYSFGDGPKLLDEYAWYVANSGEEPRPVGQKKPNAWGLHDMHGNVAEWVLDRYSKSFYSKAPAAFPLLLPGEEEYPHVIRGGSWDDKPEQLRSAARRASERSWNRRDPQDPQSIWWLTDATTVGFRVIRPLNEPEQLRGFRSKTKKGSGPVSDE